MIVTITRVVKGSKRGDEASTCIFDQKCSLLTTNGILHLVRQRMPFMGNSYLVMISYILETSKSKPDRKLSFIMKNLRSKFHIPKFFKNGRSHSKSAVFWYFSIFCSIFPCFNIWHVIYCRKRNFERNMILVFFFKFEPASENKLKKTYWARGFDYMLIGTELTILIPYLDWKRAALGKVR